MTRLSPDQLNAAWQHFSEVREWARPEHDYSRVNRRYTGKGFEEWLFSLGGFIIQDHGKLYLDFTDDQQASYFILKYL